MGGHLEITYCLHNTTKISQLPCKIAAWTMIFFFLFFFFLFWRIGLSTSSFFGSKAFHFNKKLITKFPLASYVALLSKRWAKEQDDTCNDTLINWHAQKIRSAIMKLAFSHWGMYQVSDGSINEGAISRPVTKTRQQIPSSLSVPIGEILMLNHKGFQFR